MNFSLLKKMFVVVVALLLSFNQTVFAGKDGKDSPAEQTSEDTESSIKSATFTADFMQTMTVIGSLWGSLKILGEYKQFAIDYVRPFCVGVESVYSSGQNPFADPLHICRGIDRICETYSLSEKGRKNLRDFASPIISQLCQALIDNGGVLPYDFAFSKNTTRSLYFRGESGSGKSRLVMEELPKVFLKDPRDAIIVTNGKGFSDSEDIINALLGVPQYHLGMGISLVKQRNLGEKIRASAGRGIVVFDDYTKYNTSALDKCILSLHDEGKLNTPQGEIDCPAMLFFFSSCETEEEFFICPEQEVEKIIPARLLSGNRGGTIHEKTIVRKVGHPEGFTRKTRFVSLNRLSGGFLRDILNSYFSTTILPITWKNARVELSHNMLDELVRLNESLDDSAQKAFDMASIQTALLNFRKLFIFRPQESPDLIVDYEDCMVKVHFKNPEEEESHQTNLDYIGRELDLHPVQQIGCFKSFCRRFGISSFFSSFFSCCCNKESIDEDSEYSGNDSQNHDHPKNLLHIRKVEEEESLELDTISDQERQLPKPGSSRSTGILRIDSPRHCRSKSFSCDSMEKPMEDIEEIQASLLE